MILGGSNYIDSTGSGWYKANTEILEGFIGCTSFGYQKTSAKPDAANSKHRGQVETSNLDKKNPAFDRIERFRKRPDANPRGRQSSWQSGEQRHHQEQHRFALALSAVPGDLGSLGRLTLNVATAYFAPSWRRQAALQNISITR